jgi:DNA mismatch endonuclease (patch repair protein)
MDVLTPEQRHYNMSRIHAKNTKPELIVRKWLWHNGYRYRLHKKDLPGKPDIVLQKYQVVIFINGCFWHRHNCKYASTPQTRKEFWEKKLNDNVKRDRQNIRKLRALNWRVLIIWECEIKKWDSILEKKIIDFICVANDISVEGLYDNYEEIFYTAAEEEPDYVI